MTAFLDSLIPIHLTIAFDVDDTLVIPGEVMGTKYDQPNWEVIDIYKWFQRNGHRMIVWSYGGKAWAEEWNDRLGLNADECRFKDKNNPETGNDVDIAFDDCNLNIAKVMVKVRRYKNSIERRPPEQRRNP